MKGNEVMARSSVGPYTHLMEGDAREKLRPLCLQWLNTTSVCSIVEHATARACTIMVEIMKLSYAGHERAFVRKADSWPTSFRRF
jgi:hypothetical protein